MNNVHFSSKSNEWATPQDFFDEINKEFHFTLDVAATHENRKCTKYFNIKDDALTKSWANEIIWCNPPYGRELGKWVLKAHDEAQGFNTTVVMLIPARTDTKYFHEYIYHKAEIRFIKGRLKFGDSKNSAPFPSMLVIFNHKRNEQ